MKAAVLSAYGSNQNVQIEEVELPEPRDGEMLVRIAAAGVNAIDWKIRDGAGERLGLTLPIRLGRELVGTVQALGSGVDDYGVGDVIYGMVSTGGFAEYASVRAADMVRVPAGLDAVRAAALPLAGTTAWQSMFDTAGLVAGQRLLITNGSGGVGSLAVQFAKSVGAHVTAVASGRNEQFIRDLGADEFIDYKTQPFDEIAHGMDVVFDTVGGDMFQRAFKTLKPGGFMVTIVAFPNGEAERHGVEVVRQYAKANATDLAAITQLVNDGKVTPHLDTVLPFNRLKQALELSESGHVRGKIVLSMASDVAFNE